MEDEIERKIRIAAEFLLGDPDPTTKDFERIKKDPDIKSQMRKIMGWRYPGQRQENTCVAAVVGILGFVVFIVIIVAAIWLS